MAAEVTGTRTAGDERPPLDTPNASANAGGMIAAAMRLDPADRQQAARVKAYRQEWQHFAWDFYEALSEIHYGHDYYGNVLSRVRLFAGYQGEPDDPPVPLDEFGPTDELPEGADRSVVTAAVDEMRRLDAGSDGGLAGIAGDLGVNLALAGEAFLHGKEDPDMPGGEHFAVYSTDEFKATDTGYAIYPKGASISQPVADSEFVLRVWRRLRRFRDLADAPMRAMLDDCDNLLTLKRVMKASSQSRMHGGIFLYPQEWTFPVRAQTDPNAAGQAMDNPLTEEMVTAFTTPIIDPSSVNSVMPLLVSGPAATLKEARWIDLGRSYGNELVTQIEGVRKQIAVGLDLPVEVLTGMSDMNHWSAWQVAEETFKAHIEPLLLAICRALTDGYLWPALRARGLDPTGIAVWYDPSALIGHPDLFANMQAMHAVYAVSDAALRRAGGASDDDEPDQDEIDRRLYIAQQQRVTIRETGVAPAGDVQDPSALDTAPNRPPVPTNTNQGPPAGNGREQATPVAPSRQAAGLVAAGLPDSRVARLGPRCAEIDRDLTARMQTLADAALQRVLERAGAAVARKVRGRAKSGASQGLSAELAKVDLALIPQHLGRDRTLALGLAEDDLIDGQLGPLEADYRKLCARALVAALVAGRRAVPDGGLDAERIDLAVKEQHATWLDAGFAILAGAVLGAAHDQLFTPAQQPSGPGELDLSARVSTSAVRDSLAVAGGASTLTPATPADGATGGVATGTMVMDIFRESLSILPQGWQWVYGYPDREFEPHANLEGVEFSSWTDDILANTEAFPETDYYRPGDHLGCGCQTIPMFESDRADDEPPEDAPEEG